jgi:hypothetical protein
MTLLILGAIPAVARAAATLPCPVIHVQLPSAKPLDPEVVGGATLLTADYRHTPGFLDFVDSTIKPLAPQAVVSVTESGLEPAAAAAEHLGVAGVTPQVVRVTRDKSATRRALARHAPHLNPDFAGGDDAAGVAGLFARHGKVIAKPVDGTGSLAIEVFEHEHEVDVRLRTSATLFEEFVGGREYSVEAMSANGRHTVVAIAQKGTADGFVEVSHIMPPVDLDERARTAVESATVRLLDAVGLTEGPSHTEVKVDGERVTVIETHSRTGGDGIAELVHLTTGIEWRRASIAWAIGESPRRSAPPAPAAARVFFTAEPGRVAAVAPRLAPAGARIVEWELTAQVGDMVRPLRSSGDRLGSATLTAESATACAAAVATLTAAPLVTTEPVA